MKNIFSTLFLLMIILISQDSFSKEIQCKLRGNVVGENSKYLVLIRQGQDPREHGVKIPIIDGRFEYELKTGFVEEFTLIFEDELSAFRPINFFAENGTVDFVLHPSMEFDKNTIKGGPLTTKMILFGKDKARIFDPNLKLLYAKQDLLYKSNSYFSKEVNVIQEKYKGLENGEELNKLYKLQNELLETEKGYTPDAWILIRKFDSIQRKVYEWQNNYIKTNQDLFSYSLLIHTIQNYQQHKKTIDLDVVSSLFATYAKKYPSNPYTKQYADVLNGIKAIKVGSLFVNFSAETLEGKSVKISELVNGKVALINMWGSWCAPCRVTGKSYIPIYEKYKEKGFVIVGIAGEFKNAEAFKIALEKDKYPWLNLIELDGKNKIWNKYNISNSGGNTYLIDTKGEILAIHPDAKELEKILEKLL